MSDLQPLTAAELDELKRKAKEGWITEPVAVLRLIEQVRAAELLVVQLRDVLGWGCRRIRAALMSLLR